MRNSPLKAYAKKAGNSQGLSPTALRAKRERDDKSNRTPARMAKKAENQRIGQSSNYDIHHKSDGSTEKISVASNRNVWKRNERT